MTDSNQRRRGNHTARAHLSRQPKTRNGADFFLRNKKAEWEDYRRQVTPYEISHYLPVL